MTVSSCLPLIEEIDTKFSAPALFELFHAEPNCFFLDSGMDPQKLGRYSFIGYDPFLILKSRGSKITVLEGAKQALITGSPFRILGQYLDKFQLKVTNLPAPFSGGAVGYLGYDLCHFVERLPHKAKDDLKLPEMYFCFYDLIAAYDHLLNKSFVISSGFPETKPSYRTKKARERLREFKRRLENSGDGEPKTLAVSNPAINCNFTHDDYVKAVARARQYIIDGDIFEVNLSQRFETDLSVPPYDLYRRLRRINPAPFASYLGFDEVAVVSASPERFLKVQGDYVETRPIKGTIRRGKTAKEDFANARELLSSVKDHAENMMIVDLERNDLGRVCRYGSVKVSELTILEKFPTVYHLTSTVTGRLREDKNRIDLLEATFPGGSITGAPKIRAMEIIDEFEPTRRSIYTGSIGYLGFDGSIDLNIVIRTFLIKNKRAYFQLGGAVVYDSDPEAEYQETLDKGRALVNALGMGMPQ